MLRVLWGMQYYLIPTPFHRKKEDSIAKSWMGRSNNCSKVVHYTLINN